MFDPLRNKIEIIISNNFLDGANLCSELFRRKEKDTTEIAPAPEITHDEVERGGGGDFFFKHSQLESSSPAIMLTMLDSAAVAMLRFAHF